MVYIVTYDLKKPDRNYEGLFNGIKSFGTWWHQTGSVWVIVTTKTSIEVRNYLEQFIDPNDKLYVGQLMNNWAAVGFKQEEYDWLNRIPNASWTN